jgi:hypothetical protein
VSLHYSVNGGAEKTVSVACRKKGAKTAEGKYVLRWKTTSWRPAIWSASTPTAKDARNTTKTDIYFIQAEPFERNYSQAQSGGGGGGMGGGDNDQQISQRQKDIIAATWNEYKNGSKDASVAADDAKFLAEQEAKLAATGQVAGRSHEGARAGRRQSAIPRALPRKWTEASQGMIESAQKIRGQKWNDAMPLEQKALQAAQRAEATFRDIQVAFGTQGGGGGGAGGAGRDLENLADLELDREKNQYETGQQSASDSRSRRSTRRCRSCRAGAPAAGAGRSRRISSSRSASAGSRKCCGAKPNNCQKQMEQLQRGDSSTRSNNAQHGGRAGSGRHQTARSLVRRAAERARNEHAT